MKPLTLLKIAVAIAASPIGFATAALAGPQAIEGTTLFSTPQSEVVITAIQRIREGNLGEFQKLLSGGALTRYGTAQGMAELRALLEGDTKDSIINTRSQIDGTLRPETWAGLVTIRAYNVEVLKDIARIFIASVQCSGLFEPVIKAASRCQFADISVNSRAVDLASQSDDLAHVNGRNPEKQISEAPLALDMGPDSPGSNGTAAPAFAGKN